VAAAVRIAIAVFEGAEELDFVGPWEVLTGWRHLYPEDVEVFLVGEDSEPVTCAKGMRVLADRSWDELGDVDILVYPGGRGTRAQLDDDRIRARLRGLKERGTLMTSSAPARSSTPTPGSSTASRRRPTGARSTSCCRSDARSQRGRTTASSTPAM
jgi:transcriptional regulator GlxA family with amidase domain